MLERANLIKGEIKFTQRDAYRSYVLTKKGNELAEELLKEE
jgi:Mn-dependent DtxR family transcriptional regulator